MSDETKKHNQGDLDSDGIPILTHTIKTNTNEAPTPAALVGDYRLVREIGRGATAVVYLCEHINSGGEYAIKMLRQGIATDWHQKMLENEARLAGRLEHKNIAGICDAAPDKGYVVMEYINGKSLDQHSNEGTLLPVHTVVNIIKEVAEALNYSSRQNVLHLDIKPGNIIVSEDFSRIKVMDFGCASIDGSRDDAILVAGSINYISPEQLTPGAQIDARTDIYALGSVFYRLITGKVTYRSKENLALPEIIRLITSQPHVPVMEYRQDVDIEVVAIIDRMLQKKPEHRYASWFDVIFDLARLSADFAKSSKVLPGPRDEPAKPAEKLIPPAAATVKRPPNIEQSTIDLVLACSIFSGLAEPDIYELIHNSNFRKLSPYESLMNEGEKGDMFYIILQGGLNMFRHGDMLLQPASGETIGEEVCFTELPGIYCFTVKAREHVSVLAMQKSMRRLLNNAVRDRLNEALLKSMNTKLLQLDAYEGKKTYAGAHLGPGKLRHPSINMFVTISLQNSASVQFRRGVKMKHIVWVRELELGIPAIDSQHRQLVNLVNELNDALVAKDRPKTELIFEETLDYLVSHFEFEEKLQEKADYCYAKAHRRVHQIFMRKVDTLRNRARYGEDAALELLQMLKKWLTHHIRNEDLDYVEAVQQYLEASTPEISKWLAAASPLGAAA